MRSHSYWIFTILQFRSFTVEAIHPSSSSVSIYGSGENRYRYACDFNQKVAQCNRCHFTQRTIFSPFKFMPKIWHSFTNDIIRIQRSYIDINSTAKLAIIFCRSKYFALARKFWSSHTYHSTEMRWHTKVLQKNQIQYFFVFSFLSMYL